MDDFIINGGSGSGSSRRKLPEQEKKKEEKEPISMKALITVLVSAMIFIIMLASVVIPVISVSVGDKTVIEVDGVEDYSVDNPNPTVYRLSKGSAINSGSSNFRTYEGTYDLYSNFIEKIEDGEYVTEGWNFSLNFLDWTPGETATDVKSKANLIMIKYYPQYGTDEYAKVTTNLGELNTHNLINIEYTNSAESILNITIDGASVFEEPARLWIKNGLRYNSTDPVMYQTQKYTKTQTDSINLANDNCVYCIPTRDVTAYAVSLPAKINYTSQVVPLQENYRYADSKIYEKTSQDYVNTYTIYSEAQDFSTVSVQIEHFVTKIISIDPTLKNLILVIPTILIVMFIAYLCRNFMSFGGRGGKGGQE